MEEHAESHIDDTVHGHPAGSTSRRGLLAALVAGGVTAFVAPALATGAGAATDENMVQRTPEDNGILNALLVRETRMTATYKDIVGATTDQEFRAGFLLIHDHHLAYAQAIKGFLGVAADDPANTARFIAAAGTTSATSAALAALEEETVAAHLDALARIKGVDAAALIASIVTAEARHAAALALVSGQSAASIAAR